MDDCSEITFILPLTVTDIQRLLLIMEIADTLAGGLSRPERELYERLGRQKRELLLQEWSRCLI